MLTLAKASHLPRRTVRLRLTLLYGGLFLLSGAALLTMTYFFVDAATGNAFIVQGKGGTTIAGYEIGNPDGIGPINLRHHGSQQTTQHVSGGASSSSSAHGGPFPKSTGPSGGVSGAAVTGTGGSGKETKAEEQDIAAQTREFTALAYAYRNREREQLLLESGIALGIMAIVSVLLGWLMAGRVLRPLRTITATTRDISVSNLHERLDVRGPDDELKELGDTIDGLLERLESSFRSQRQFVANASHELRTPLARQRTLAQVALSDPEANADSLRAAHERILASGEQQEQLIDALLTLSRAQAATVQGHEVDLRALVDDQVGAREAEAAVRQVRIVSVLGPASLRADRRLVERLVENLLDNALRHNVAGGTVSVETGSRAGGARLTVSNDGPTIPAADVARLYEPFERLEPERSTGNEGFGLGLCIVRAVAAAHGALVTTVPRATGGLSIEVQFPGADRTEVGDEAVGPGAQAAAPEGGGHAGTGPAGTSGPAGIRPGLVHASPSDH
jgi:signal transduction histidine kinase